jgi:GntR family transcriptional repressor for pyruvate dehydrogenase complex
MAAREPASEHPTFAPVRRVRSFDDVVAQLREAILAGQIRQGERLPGERDLSRIFAVSRPTIREALRSLEANGVIEIRLGKTGGAFAVAPASTTVGDAVATLVNHEGASLRDLAEFRLSFEPENAWLAAQRADEDEIEQLEQLVRDAHEAATHPGSWEQINEIDARWHEALAHATKNTLRVGISQGIHDAVTHQIRALKPTAEQYVTAVPAEIEQITRAVRERRPEEAREAMRRHIERFNRLNPALGVGSG